MEQRFFRSVKDFEAEADPKPSVAERALIAAVRGGTEYEHAATRPTARTSDNTVRAALLRLLIMGGTPDCGLHKAGVVLEGAWIEGALDLQFCTAQGRTALNKCHFAKRLELAQADLKELSLQGSHLEEGLYAQGARIVGAVFLRRTQAKGTIVFTGATIGGQLACVGATLSGPKDADGTVTGDAALIAQGAKVGADVFLSEMQAVGTVDFNGATIGGQLACVGATLSGPRDADGTVTGDAALIAQGAKVGADVFLSEMQAVGTVDFNGATIGGQLACVGATLSGPRDADGTVTGHALNAQSVVIGEGLYFREVTSVIGDIELEAGHCRFLADDAESWESCKGNLYLDGFTYDRIGATSPTTLATRGAWLRRGRCGSLPWSIGWSCKSKG